MLLIIEYCGVYKYQLMMVSNSPKGPGKPARICHLKWNKTTTQELNKIGIFQGILEPFLNIPSIMEYGKREKHFFGIFLIFKESKQNHCFHLKERDVFYKAMKYYLL